MIIRHLTNKFGIISLILLLGCFSENKNTRVIQDTPFYKIYEINDSIKVSYKRDVNEHRVCFLIFAQKKGEKYFHDRNSPIFYMKNNQYLIAKKELKNYMLYKQLYPLIEEDSLIVIEKKRVKVVNYAKLMDNKQLHLINIIPLTLTKERIEW